MIIRRFFAIASCFALLCPVSGPLLSQNTVEFDADLLPPSFHKSRRDSVMARIGNDAIAILYSASVRTRNNDVEYQYRQDDNFFYLTGFPEPNAVLLLVPRGMPVRNPADTTALITVREILFVEPRNLMRERWDGRRYGPEGAMKFKGIEVAFPLERLRQIIGRGALFGLRHVYVPPFRSDLTGEIVETLVPIRAMMDRQNSQVEWRDPSPIVNRMRSVKTPEEISILRRATAISAAAHNQAMMSVTPKMFEYEIQAVYEYVYRKLGAEYQGYPCIVGSGENSVILHYNTNRKQIREGEIIVADCAAEYHNYSSDVTRSYPANGKFTKEQRQVYFIVLEAQKAAIATMKPGVSWSSVSAEAERVIEEGLVNAGLVKEKNGREFRRFYWHGLGHPVGLTVHDVGVQVLEPGVVYTVEPGVYIPAGTEGVDPRYFNIGVRIEDVVLITPNGNEVLSSASPTDPDAIEGLMKKTGVGNSPVE